MTSTKKLIWVVTSLGLFIDGYDLYISAITEPFINATYHPDPLLIGFMQACAPIGAMFGAILMGYCADKFGRKSMLLFNFIFFVLISLLCALSWNITSLCLFRFFIGVGVGADYPVCAAYMSEMSNKKDTATLFAFSSLIFALASPVGILIAWATFKLHPHLNIWRFLFASGSIPALIGVCLRAKLPESFVWQAHRKLSNQCSQKINYKQKFKQLFTKKLYKITFALSFCWFLMDISYYGIGLFTPQLLQALNLNHAANLLNDANNLLLQSLIINTFIVFGAGASIYIIKRINYVLLQKIGFFCSGIGLLILSLANTNFPYLNTVLLFIGFIAFNFFMNIGPAVTTYFLPTQYYTTDIRATGHGFASGTAKLGAFLGAILVPILQQNIGIYATVFILAFTLCLGFIFSFYLEEPQPECNALLAGNHN